MLRVGLTQRVDVVPSYGERRDALDQNWARLIVMCDHLPLPVPNAMPDPAAAIARMGLDALVLTGGNDIAHLPGAANPAPERDATEAAAIAFARDRGLPLLAVCRGLQMLNLTLGGTVERAVGHVGSRHRLDRPVGGIVEVNSFHGWWIPANGVAPGLTAKAHAPDGTVEAVLADGRPWLGIMWHPEREMNDPARQVALVREVLEGRASSVSSS
jgi:gamma-glutamyl-gamma-aminobutyrate hydrolase PuuD